MDWCPFAVRIDGPPAKQGYGDLRARIGKGLMGHSAEGEWPGMYGRLMSTDPVSWTGSILASGVALQHYPLSACCWHAGSRYPNIRWSGWELEGRVGEPLTEPQKLTLVDVIVWQDEQEHWPGFLFGKDQVLTEHNMYYPTACPSGRIPWQEVINMAMLFEELKARLTALEGYRKWTQAGLDKHGQDIHDLTGGVTMQQGMIVNLDGRVKKLEGVKPTG